MAALLPLTASFTIQETLLSAYYKKFYFEIFFDLLKKRIVLR